MNVALLWILKEFIIFTFFNNKIFKNIIQRREYSATTIWYRVVWWRKSSVFVAELISLCKIMVLHFPYSLFPFSQSAIIFKHFHTRWQANARFTDEVWWNSGFFLSTLHICDSFCNTLKPAYLLWSFHN